MSTQERADEPGIPTRLPMRFPSASSMAARLAAHASRHPTGTALVEGDRQWTWRDLADASVHLASALEAAGAHPGHRLLVVTENGAEAFITLLAAQRLGVWPALLNARVPLLEMRKLAAVVEPRFVLFCRTGSDSAAAHARESKAEPLWEPMPGIGYSDFDGNAEAHTCTAGTEEDIGVMLFTSGTTGQPKAAMFSHRALLAMGEVVSAARGTRQSDVIDVSAPFSHIMAITSMATSVHVGAAMRIRPRLAPAELALAIGKGEINQISMVPAAWSKVLERLQADSVDISRHALRQIITGGSPLQPALARRVEALFGLPLINTYGMTECGPIARTRGFDESRPSAVGQPEPAVEVRIVGSDGTILPHDATGEIHIKSPAAMTGYFRDMAATRDALPGNGWLVTGDYGALQADGTLLITGRKKELIIRSGFNVYPAEVESILAEFEGVAQVAVTGETSDSGEESVIAFLAMRSGPVGGARAEALRREIDTYARSRLVPYKCPSHYEFIDEMPVSTSGKIIKSALRRRV